MKRPKKAAPGRTAHNRDNDKLQTSPNQLVTSSLKVPRSQPICAWPMGGLNWRIQCSEPACCRQLARLRFSPVGLPCPGKTSTLWRFKGRRKDLTRLIRLAWSLART